MGKKIEKEAMQLGLTNLPKYTFFGRPKKIKVKASKYKPDTAYAVENWMKSVDPTCAVGESTKMTRGISRYYYMTTQLGIYVEIFSRIAQLPASPWNPDNYVFQIDINTNNEDHVRAIAKSINSLWENGILPNIDFKKIEKRFKVRKEDVIKQWNAFL